jgi:hypothetical protein
MQIYIICPVRNSTLEDQKFALDYVARLEAQGITVYFPPRDSDQTEDGIGLRVNEANRAGLLSADEVHVIWDPKSIGSHFDLGMVFMLRTIRDCPVILVNPVKRTATKSYSNVVIELANI